MRFFFVSNLRLPSVEAFSDVGFVPSAWLLSTHRLTSGSEAAARRARAEGVPLFADNGTKELIDDVIKAHTDDLAPLTADIRTLRRSLPGGRRVPTPSEVPTALRRAARAAAHSVTDTVDDILASAPLERVIAQQERMQPTHVIAKEDFATACLMALGLEREITGLPVAFFTRRNAITFRYWKQTVDDARMRGRRVYATLGATDYNTARAAARLAAKQGIRDVAVGYAGINRDTTFVRSYLAGPRHQLPGAAPRRNVRGTAIAIGVRDGYREAGVRLRSFHALGMGAAPFFASLASAFDWFTTVTIDATSPVHDAVNDLVFYDHERRGDRASVTEIAERVVAGGEWSFSCPFCAKARQLLGHRPVEARQWAVDNAKPKITTAHLHPDQPLGHAIPVFATARGGRTSTQQRSRAAHNHWVLDQLASSTPTSKRRDWGIATSNELADSREGHVRFGLLAALQVLEDLGP